MLDQEGWHGSGGLVVPPDITLVPLPPYSPELNPVERVWLHLKARFLSHVLHNDYDAIVEAASTTWNRLKAEVARGFGGWLGRRRGRRSTERFGWIKQTCCASIIG